MPRTIVQPLQRFLDTEAASGVLLLGAALIALIWANSPLSESYIRLWETPLTARIGDFELSEDLRHWVNDLLMALFFFVVGLEIKREIVHGELRDARAAMLPVVCAVGGMLAPALLYLVLNAGGPGAPGWGIPMATDIAFAVGVLALLGSRVPPTLKVFLLTLAIVDDIGAILVIALFYPSGLSGTWLAVAAATAGGIVVLQRLQVRAMPLYVAAAALLWLSVFSSGVHATIAGVVLGLLTPAWPFHPPEHFTGAMDAELQWVRRLEPGDRAGEGEQSSLLEVARLAQEAVSPLERLEGQLHPWSAYVVLPLFALANAGVVLSPEALGRLFSEPVTLGVIIGLVLGKPLGIVGAAALAITTTPAILPRGSGWPQMVGVAAIAGVGFTVSIFVAGLAFPSAELADAAKVGVLLGSTLAAIIGAGALLLLGRAGRDETKRTVSGQ